MGRDAVDEQPVDQPVVDPLTANAVRLARRLDAQRRTQRRAMVGVLGGVLVLGGIGLAGRRDDGPPKPVAAPSNDPAAAEAFLAANARSRAATWKVTERFTRRFGASETLRSTTIRVQTPEATLVNGAGSITITGNGTVTACSAESAASGTIVRDIGATAVTYRCRKGAGASDAQRDAATKDDLDGLRALVTGRAPLYAVSRLNADCFQLRIRAANRIAPPFGVRADLCYDPTTGAPTRSEVEKDAQPGRPRAIDLTVAADVTGTVLPSDLLPPIGAVFF